MPPPLPVTAAGVGAGAPAGGADGTEPSGVAGYLNITADRPGVMPTESPISEGESEGTGQVRAGTATVFGKGIKPKEARKGSVYEGFLELDESNDQDETML